MLKFVRLFAALVAVGGFASHAEAHDSDGFGPRSFFRDQGRLPHESHCEKERRERMEAEFASENAMRQAQIQAQQAAQAAATKRARLAALRQQKAFAAKRAAAAAAARRVATAANTRTQTAAAIAPASAKKESERTAPPASAATTIASVEQPVSTPRPTKAISEVCRKYSAAADGLIDVPCN